LASVATDPTTGALYPSTYDIFTVGAGYLDIGAALTNSDTAYYPALSPSVYYNSLLNTAILLSSSVALEVARRALKSHGRTKFNGWWTAGTVLGMLFLSGQVLAWNQLNAANVFISTNPSSSFFFVLTVAHAVHLLGGVSALFYVDVQALRLSLGPAKRTAIDISAIFWHFLDGLWLYLMVLFYVWG